jgi:hypothetical protein
MQTAAKRIIGVCILMPLFGCYSVSSYRGDGKLIGGEWRLFGLMRSYDLDLGSVDLTSMGSYSYRMANLPEAQFTVGIEVIEANPNNMSSKQPSHPCVLYLALDDEKGNSVIREQESLDSWTWSYSGNETTSYYYRRGSGIEIPLGNGTTQGQRIGVKASNGWGSYFDADESTTYHLTFRVLSPDTSMRPARLVLHRVQGFL